MITKNDAKFIKSLQLKKFRTKEQAFVVEGGKNVLEVLKSDLSVLKLYVTAEFVSEYENELVRRLPSYIVATEKSLASVGNFKTNNMALAVVRLPEISELPDSNDFILAFENLQDPGNLGTIIRTADWYGFKQIVCSRDSVDVYNPKTIAATMGSFCRIQVRYLDLEEFLPTAGLPVYGAVLGGDDLHNQKFNKKGIILFGNESQGISKQLQECLDHRIFIKGYGSAESLNVGIATGILCDNLRRVAGL